jgi:hypothetical protein
MMSNHGIHSVSIDKVMIQILVILISRVHMIFTVIEKNKISYFVFLLPFINKLGYYNCVRFHKNSISSLVGVALTRYMPLSQGNYCITLKNSQVSAMGVKHHYQQHQLRNITASQFKRWRTREYSNKKQNIIFCFSFTLYK